MGMFFGLLNNRGTPTPVVTSNIKYGRLYNWPAISDPLFAPAGWHVPTKAELQTLINEIGSELGGGKLKTSGLDYWLTPNEGATNELGFNGRGSGFRSSVGFDFIKNSAYIIGNTINVDIISFLSFNYVNAQCAIIDAINNIGVSVRLIKDNSSPVPSVTDLDGNIYRTCKIGDQVWIADNWACTKLNDDTPIPNVTDGPTWVLLNTAAYCNYDNDLGNVFL